MIVNIHKNFFDSILKLSSKDQNRVTSTISQILSDSDNNGLRLHKVGQFWSYSPSMSLRLIAWKKDNTILMLHVDQHDDAYKWAERNSTILNNKGEFIGLVNVSIKQSEEYENPKKSIDVIKLSRLVNIGLTENFSEYLLLLDDFILLEVIESLAPEYQEAILDVITTDSEAQKIINTLPSHIFTVQDDEGLKYALSLPESKWRLFIHPKQKFAVDIPADRNILLRGGPGTGKTVTIIHRFVKLHREQINSTLDSTSKCNAPESRFYLKRCSKP